MTNQKGTKYTKNHPDTDHSRRSEDAPDGRNKREGRVQGLGRPDERTLADRSVDNKERRGGSSVTRLSQRRRRGHLRVSLLDFSLAQSQ